MASRTAKSHDSWRKPFGQGRRRGANQWRLQSSVVCQAIVTRVALESHPTLGVVLNLKTDRTRSHVVGVPPEVFKRLADMLRPPFLYYPGEYDLSDGRRVMDYLQDKWVRIRWYHMRNGHGDKWIGHMIKLCEVEESNG
jgi:hypothetical protein